MQKKKLAGLLLTLTMVANLFTPVFAAETKEAKAESTVLSLEMAQDKAAQNEYSIIKTNRSIKNLVENNKYAYNEGDFYISDTAYTINNLYNRLKNGSSMNSKEYAKLYILYTMYGDTVYFNGKQDITKYMNPNRFVHYSLWANVMKLSLGNQITESTIKYQTRVLYDSILSMKGQLEILNMSIELQEKLYKQQKNMYDSGKVSKVALDAVYKRLQIQKLEVKKLTRNLENLEINLKDLTGLPITSQIDLIDYSKNEILELDDYDTYLERALINRNEIVLAKIDYWVSKNDFTIANDAFSDNPWNVNAILNKSIAEQSIKDAELSISTSKESVIQNINDLYIDVKYKKEEMDICKDKLDYENEQYRIILEKYKKKLITETEKMNGELNKLSALIAYNNAVRTYNSSVVNLQQASMLGLAN